MPRATTALRIAPRDAKNWFLLAEACWKQGRREAAQQAIEKALTLKPGQPELLRLKGQIEAP